MPEIPIEDIPEIVKFYSDNLRGSLFSAFMTLTGFLFTLHAFLLVTLYRDIYGKPEYHNWVTEQGAKYNPDLKPNQPLRQISGLLFFALICSFLTAISQLSLGLIKAKWSVYLCLGFAAFTIVVFAVVLWMFRRVIASWLDFIDDHPPKKKDKET